MDVARILIRIWSLLRTILRTTWRVRISRVGWRGLLAAVIDVGPKVFEDGMAYVALRSVTTLDGVAIIDLVSSKTKAFQLATKEIDRLRGADVQDREE